MLRIKNQQRLLGKRIYSKFLPQLGEWKVVSILRDDFRYDIKIQNTKSPSDWDKIHLDRRPYYDPGSFEPHYKLWGMDTENLTPKSNMIKKGIIADMDRFVLYMVMLLKEMRPTT